MITKDTIDTFSKLTAQHLTEMIRCAGYKKDTFQGARFVGITNGAQFCYEVDYDDFGELTRTKVFVFRNSSGLMTVDY